MTDDPTTLRQRFGLAAGGLLFGGVLMLPPPDALDPAAWRTAAVGLLMAVWWITEALPIAATALVPLVLFPILGVTGIDGAAQPYANPLIFLFLGGFLIAQAMQTWRLHRRIALGIVSWVGVQPTSIIVGFILASAFLSMWVSNTATALMMLPIGLSILDLTQDR
ncbi:MAG: SLC13 family permease, partial [Salinibacter sp.]